MSEKTSFETLCKLDVSKHIEKKNGLSYLSWAYAWAEFKKAFPTATYQVLRGENGLPYVYDDKTGYMVFTQITVDGIPHEMWLPVMDSNNFAMKKEPYEVKTKYKTFSVAAATMFDVNKAIMRCFVKNIAVCSGIGLSLYAGEDLPFIDEPEPKTTPAKKAPAQTKSNVPVCAVCGKAIEAGGNMTAEQVAQASIKKYTQALCQAHRNERKKQLEEAQSAADNVQLPFEIE